MPLGKNLASGVKSFKDFARGVLDSISSVIGGLIKQGVAAAVTNALKFLPFPANIAAGSIAGGLASGLFKGLLSKNKTTRISKRGNCLWPNYRNSGRYKGVRSNPEVIAPLDKLTDIMGRSQTNTGDLKLVAKIKDRENVIFY